MASAIVQIIASIMAYLAARGLDMILGKWVAYIVIAMERIESKAALDSYRETTNNIAKEMADKAQKWDDWRNNRPKVE